jgi:hypothetical protein
MEATVARMDMIIENNHLHRIYIMMHFKFMVDCMIILIFMEHIISSSNFSGVRVARSVLFCVVFCRSLFVLLSVFFWPLYYLSFDSRLLFLTLASDFPCGIYKPFLFQVSEVYDMEVYLGYYEFKFTYVINAY